MDRAAWWATVHGDAKSWTLLRAGARARAHTHTHTQSHVECTDLVVEY